MFQNIIPKRYANALLKHVVAVTLFIPYFYSKTNYFYFPDYILANFFAILAIITILTSWKLDLRRNGILLAGMSILVVAYNVCAPYLNHNYLHWYGEQINTTISFLLFMVLLMVKDPHALIDQSTIRGIIHMMVISNVVSIAFRLITKYNAVLIMNTKVYFTTYEENISEHYAWLYVHKSQYALLLVLCIAFCVVFKNVFRNLFTYLLTLGVLLFSLYLSNTLASLGACMLIFVGQFLDYLMKAKWWKKLIAAVGLGVPGCMLSVRVWDYINTEREMLTLGGRTLIWKGFWNYITINPYGLTDISFGNPVININVPGTMVATINNAHNVFLNQMFRYSIPVGDIYICIFFIIILFSLKRNFSFKTLFTWIALLVPMNMDYSLTSIELTFFLFLIYIMFFHKR